MVNILEQSEPASISYILQKIALNTKPCTSHKNNCQEKQPAHLVITKHDSILRSICFCEEYSKSGL